jgi:UDP-N-acetylglucosamine/UDP-N-acetylgalactosamine diphosphorylase
LAADPLKRSAHSDSSGARAGEAAAIDDLRKHFASFGQDHVFRFWDRLDDAGRKRLAAQAAAIDLASLAYAHVATRQLAAPGTRRLEPARIEALPERGGDPAAWRRADERGRDLLASGRVAVMVVAGGQGTRLGFEGPKGSFPVGPITDRSLFCLQAQKIRGLRRRYGRPVPWYVMTSEATDTETRALFQRSDWFGLPEEDVFVFCQQMVPALDFDGRLLLERPDRIFESPNGHGGSLTALAASGALDDMARRGTDTVFYYQVDNPLVCIAEPAYLGFHAEAGAEMSCKVIRKREPREKMGVVARVDGRLGVVEYTELDDEHANLRDAAGELVYWAGSIAIHVLDTGFVRRSAADADHILPYHASAKKIPIVDAEGRPVQPSEPNGHKLERFVFDALPAARRVLVLETRREDEYSPIKNASGADSAETARHDLVAVYRRWLTEAGLDAPGADARVEIDHARFDGPEDLRASGIRRIAEAGDAILVAPGAPS